MSIRTGEEIYKARNTLGKLFHIEDSSRIVFTLNTTEALNLGIKGVVQSGDHVITTSMEHNSVLRPLKAMETAGVETTIIKCGRDGTLNPEMISREVKDNTKLIVCTHASNVTGTIMPIKEIGNIAKRKNHFFYGRRSAKCRKLAYRRE